MLSLQVACMYVCVYVCIMYLFRYVCHQNLTFVVYKLSVM